MLSGFDDAIERAASAALGSAGPALFADRFAKLRMCLPGRRGGGGFRKRVDVTPAAFVGNFCAVAPWLTNRDFHVEIKKGFAPGLGKIFGSGAFDGKEDCFEACSRTSRSVSAWLSGATGD